MVHQRYYTEQNVLKPCMRSRNTKTVQLTQQLMLLCTSQYPSATLVLVDSTKCYTFELFSTVCTVESDVAAPHDRLLVAQFYPAYHACCCHSWH